MKSHSRNGDSGASHSSDRVAAGQRKAIAEDMKARGGNPVTVSDVRQRYSTGVNGLIQTTLLSN